MEDEKIVALYWQRDEKAIEETDRKYSKFLFGIARNILINQEDSEECVNDTYLKAWNSIPPNRPGRLSVYLGKITRFTSIDKLRSKMALKHKVSEYTLAFDELNESEFNKDIIDDQINAMYLTELIDAFLLQLPVESRNIFVGRYFYLDSIKEIARITNSSESKVKTNLYRTRMELKQYLLKEGVEL